jgi:hypothetical protein
MVWNIEGGGSLRVCVFTFAPRSIRVFAAAADRLARKQEDRSILDSITGEVAHLQTGLGTRDRGKISDYLDNIREIERRIQMAEKRARLNIDVPETPIGVPDSFDEHAKLMYELQVLAFQAEITRVSTFMVARDLSQRTFPQIGVPEPHHSVSHHGNNPVMIGKLEKINIYHATLSHISWNGCARRPMATAICWIIP